MGLLIWLLALVLLVDYFRLRGRVGGLQRKLDELSKQFSATSPVVETRTTSEPASAVEPEIAEPDAEETVDNPFESPWEPEPEFAAATKPQGSVSGAVGTPSAPRRVVFNEQMGRRLVVWCKENWFYLIAAASLALAGIFLIQYGMERGMLAPPFRIAAAMGLGAALLAAAEWLRRRGGDTEGDDLAYLPSTLAAGGVVTLFAAVWGGFGLYGFFGPTLALVLMAALGLGTIGLGWFYGPLLSAIGVIGAIGAPFLIGGDSTSVYMLNYYFLVVVIAALAIDALKRWAWLSALALVAGFAAALLIYTADPVALHLMLFSGACVIAASTLPIWSPEPVHRGATVLGAFWRNARGSAAPVWPEFPTRVAWGTVLGGTLVVLNVQEPDLGSFQLGLAGFAVLLALTLVWMRKAPALEDVALIPGTGLLLLGLFQGPNFAYFSVGFAPPLQSGADEMVLRIGQFVGLGVVASAVAAWRSFDTTARRKHYWALFAVTFAPLVAVVAELAWAPAQHIGPSIWGMSLALIAAMMLGLMRRYAVVDGGDKARLSYALVSAMSMIAFALVVVLSSVALTLALAVMVVSAVMLDRRFELPLLAGLAAIGAVLVSARLVLWPGILWALDAPMWEIVLGYGGSVILLTSALMLVRATQRDQLRGVLDSAVWSLGAIFASLMIYRWIDDGSGDVMTHWSLGLFGSVWLISALTQHHRVGLGGPLTRLRVILSMIYGTLSAIILFAALFARSPLLNLSEPVLGLPVFNSVLIAYGIPGLLLGFAAYWFGKRRLMTRLYFAVGAGVFGVAYVALAIRHVWRGPDISLPGVSDGELYSYTVAMMLVGSALLFVALWRRSDLLRRVALVALGLTAAKVFLIDAAGLAGLVRVVSFLALGLVLAALAWLDRRFRNPAQNTDPA